MSISRVRLGRWQQTAWGRVLIGLGLSQGLFYGLRQLLTGVLGGLTGTSPDQVGDLVHAVLVLQAMQVVAVLIGCLFTDAGQERGALLGLIVGGWNGALLMLFQNSQGATVISAYGLPLLHATLGTVAGWVGSAVWKPIPSHPVPPNLQGQRKPAARQPNVGLLSGPVKWGRILVGIALAVLGTRSSALLFERLIDVGDGKLGTTSEMQDLLITWEIQALALLLGGVFAGATAVNGIKQGLIVGFAAGFILVNVHTPFLHKGVEMSGLALLSCVSLCVVGGWFGGQLLPPVVKFRRQRGLGPMT
jgi:hypothetical protein